MWPSYRILFLRTNKLAELANKPHLHLCQSLTIFRNQQSDNRKSTDLNNSNGSNDLLNISNKSDDKSSESRPTQAAEKNLRSKLDDYIKNYSKQEGYDWIKFNHIKTAAMLTKSKIYQSGLVAFLFVKSLDDYITETISIDDLAMVNCLTFGSLLLLVIVGQLARRIIGIAYYDPSKPGLLRIAHLTFFGRRNNLIVNLNDIRPLSDTNKAVDPLFLKLAINIDGKDQIFFLANDRFATFDKEIYSKVFGSIK